jgi:hypothetical protein
MEEQRRPREIREQLSLWRQQRQQQVERPAAAHLDGTGYEQGCGHDAGRRSDELGTLDAATETGSRITH